jgi:hypothetical protein
MLCKSCRRLTGPALQKALPRLSLPDTMVG